MGRLHWILALAVVSVSTICGCAFLTEKYCPVIPPKNEQLPELKKLEQPVLHKYKFKKTETPGVYSVTREDIEFLSQDLAALVDLSNRYEKLIEEYNKIAKPIETKP